jgi:tryptophan-rich sensory protein
MPKLREFSRKFLILAFVIVTLITYESSRFTRNGIGPWYKELIKSPLNPPEIAFPIVWTFLYILIALSLWQIALEIKKQALKWRLLVFFGVQLLLNALWSPAFFGLQSPLLGLIIIVLLWTMILQNILFYGNISKIGAILLIPYFFWVSFALYLNAYIYSHN